MNAKIIIIALCALGAAIIIYALRDDIEKRAFQPTKTQVQTGIEAPLPSAAEGNPTGEDGNNGEAAASDIEVMAENLTIPWEIAFLPNGDMLVAERPGDAA